MTTKAQRDFARKWTEEKAKQSDIIKARNTLTVWDEYVLLIGQ